MCCRKEKEKKKGLIEDPRQKILINQEILKVAGIVQLNIAEKEKLINPHVIKITVVSKDFVLHFFQSKQVNQKKFDAFDQTPSPKRIINEDITNIILTGIGGTEF